MLALWRVLIPLQNLLDMSNPPGNHHLPWANLNDQPHEEQILQLQITPFEVRVLRLQHNTDTIIKELSKLQLMVNAWFGLVVWDSRGTPK